MKIKIRKLLDIKQSLEKLLGLDIPTEVAFKLSKTIKNFNNEFEAFEESKKKLFKKYGEENINGNMEIKKSFRKKFTKDIEILINIEVNIKVPKITLKDLRGTKLSAIDLSNLDILIKE